MDGSLHERVILCVQLEKLLDLVHEEDEVEETPNPWQDPLEN